jgi:AcrR family transcriptional regulator
LSRPRRDDLRLEMAEKIKAVARQLMSERGAAGLHLRAIARELGITAPAVYNYFPTLQDLITELVVDAFNWLADAMQEAVNMSRDRSHGGNLRVAGMAYRRWALDHPAEFQLIYGRLLPDYQMDIEMAAPLARRPLAVLASPLVHAYRNNELTLPPDYENLPPVVQGYLTVWKQRSVYDIPEPLVYLLAAFWYRIHGMVMLELFHHSQPMIGNPEAFYQFEVENFLASLGLGDKTTPEEEITSGGDTT